MKPTMMSFSRRQVCYELVSADWSIHNTAIGLHILLYSFISIAFAFGNLRHDVYG
jgi:hypothetical protein